MLLYSKHAYSIEVYKLRMKPQESFGFLVHDVSRLMRRHFNRRVQDLGLTQAQWQILARLTFMEGARQSQIADVLEMQPISVARLIDRMEIAGWVERRPDPDDRRAVNLYLTDKVEPILEEMWSRAAEVRALAVSGLSKPDQETLLKILQKMRGNLAAEEGK